MDILFISLSPIDSTFSMSFRNRSIISGLLQLNNSIDIITVHSKQEEFFIENLPILNNLNIVRLNSPKKFSRQNKNENSSKIKKIYKNSIFRRIYNYFIPFDTSIFLLTKISVKSLPKKHYELIITSSDTKTSHLVPFMLKRDGLIFNRWIQYWGDPFALDITTKFIYPKSWIAKLEKIILKHADKIIYVSPITLIDQKKLFKDFSHKMVYLPIPYETTKIYPPINNKLFTIGYFGFYLQNVRNILPLYDALSSFTDDIHLNIIGPSDLILVNQKCITVLPNSNDISKYESEADLIVVIMNLKGGQIPGKIFHLSGTNKPILILLDGENQLYIKEIFEKYNRFYMCLNQKDEILKSIREIRNHNKTFHPLEDFSAKRIASHFLVL